MSAGIQQLLSIMQALRHPENGCPWDLQQDFASIAPYTIEEAYEVADAIQRENMDDLKDELGDLLLQVVFHARMADREGNVWVGVRRELMLMAHAAAQACVTVEEIVEGIKHGVRKVNIDTDLRLAFTALVRETLGKNPKEFDPRKYLGPAREAVKEVVKSRMELFGSVGRA